MGMVMQLEAYLQLSGNDGRIELNNVCPNHSITLEAANIDREVSCDVKDGNLRILFREKLLGTNVHSDAVWTIGEAINAAPQQAGSSPRMSFTARLSVKQKYDAEIEGVRLRVAAILRVPSIKFSANFEQIFKELKSVKRTEYENKH
jgi:hypothetical protein